MVLDDKDAKLLQEFLQIFLFPDNTEFTAKDEKEIKRVNREMKAFLDTPKPNAIPGDRTTCINLLLIICEAMIENHTIQDEAGGELSDYNKYICIHCAASIVEEKGKEKLPHKSTCPVLLAQRILEYYKG